MTLLLLFVYTEVLHNSLLVRAAGLENAHNASGLALLLGNLISVSTLALTAWAFALPGKVHWSWVPRLPLFGLNVANTAFAHEALQLEDNVGTMLPCNVIVQDVGEERMEVAAIDPVASMQTIDNPKLKDAAAIVLAKQRSVVAGLCNVKRCLYLK